MIINNVAPRERVCRRTGRRTLGEAWPLFAAQQPQWVASPFDEVFLRHHIEPLLARDCDPSAEQIAALWLGQFGTVSAERKRHHLAQARVTAEALLALLHSSDATPT